MTMTPDENRSYMIDEERETFHYIDDMREWEHFYAFENHAGELPRWQGCIEERYSDGSMRVWLFDWLLGMPDVPQVIRPSDYGDILKFPNGEYMLDWFCDRFHPYGSEESALCLRCGQRRYEATGSRMAPWDDGHRNAGFSAYGRFMSRERSR